MREYSHKMQDGLRDLCKLLPPKATLVEVGCYAGESTKLFQESGKIEKHYCIDIWDEAYYKDALPILPPERAFDKVAEKYGVEKIKQLSGIALTDMIAEGVKADIVYIDANHTHQFARADILLALQLVKDGGIIAGHDWGYRPSIGVTKAVKEVLGYPDITFADTSWLKYKDRVGRNDSLGDRIR
jgi:SAM-dependent methyltransferase